MCLSIQIIPYHAIGRKYGQLIGVIVCYCCRVAIPQIAKNPVRLVGLKLLVKLIFLKNVLNVYSSESYIGGKMACMACANYPHE